MIREYSNYQTNIFNNIATGTGNTHVDALAGCGKTTTIIEGTHYIPENMEYLMCAFGRNNKKDLQNKLPNKKGKALTFNALGLQTIKANHKRCIVDKDKLYNYIEGEYGSDDESYQFRESLAKAITLAKANMISSKEEMDELLDQFCIDTEIPKEEFIESALSIKEKTLSNIDRIDFDDMISMPLHYNMKFNKYDVVFIDEAQDLTKAQVQLGLNSCKTNGRIISVGDEHQAIFSWRGADSNSIANLISKCNSTRLPLSVTYRCAKNIVALAQQYVPELEAAPSAKNGIVSDVDEEYLINNIRHGDFLLSRVNAPLVKLCFRLLKKGIQANIQGRDIGDYFLWLVKKSQAKTVSEFIEYLDNWYELGCAALLAKKRNISNLQDRYECFQSLAENSISIADIKSNVKKIFHDVDDTKVVLSTIHRAKGLERDRVFLLNKTCKPGTSQEETNIYYVGITRAKQELYLVK